MLSKAFFPLAGILWQHWKYNKKSQKPVCTSHISSVMRKAVHQFYCTLASPCRSVDDWWQSVQLTTTGDDKNVKTHSLDRKLTVLEQLTQRSWSDGTCWNVPDLSREDVLGDEATGQWTGDDVHKFNNSLFLFPSILVISDLELWRLQHWHKQCFSPPAANTTRMNSIEQSAKKGVIYVNIYN